MDEAGRAFSKAIAILTHRDHSVAELTRKLTSAGFSPEAAEVAVSRLQELAYLDDERYARQRVESAIRNGKGYGYRLRQELFRRGIAADVADMVLHEAAASHDEEETIKSIVARRFSSFDPKMASPRDRHKIVGYLQRRGFSISAIRRVLALHDHD